MNGLFRVAIAAGFVAFLTVIGLVVYRIRSVDLNQVQANQASIEAIQSDQLQDSIDVWTAINKIAKRVTKLEKRIP